MALNRKIPKEKREQLNKILIEELGPEMAQRLIDGETITNEEMVTQALRKFVEGCLEPEILIQVFIDEMCWNCIEKLATKFGEAIRNGKK